MTCPTPDKVTYGTLRGAASAAVDMLDLYGPQRAYACECGAFHLTTHGLDGNVLTADMVLALARAVA